MATEKDKIFDEQNLKDLWQILLNKLEPQEKGKHLSSNDFTDELKASLEGADGRLRDAVANIYKIKGSIIFEELPEDPTPGDVYNISLAFEADDRFIESERGKLFGDNINIVYTKDGWDVLGLELDLNNIIFKWDIKSILDEDIHNICQLPPFHCTIRLCGTGDDISYLDQYSDAISFDQYFNETKYVYITAIDDNGNDTRNIFYYISTAPIKLNDMNSIDWNKYTGSFNINKNGRYIIYVKIIDRLGNPKYSCTDGFILDLAKPIAIIALDNKQYSNTPVEYEKIKYKFSYNESKEISISAFDEETDTESISYFISNGQFAITELGYLDHIDWTPYESPFIIEDNGKYAIYARIIDKAQNILYIMTDGFIIDKEIPTGTIYIDDNLEYSSFESPKIQSVETDEISVYIATGFKLSKIEGIFYYVASRELSLNSLNAVNWVPVDETMEFELELEYDRNYIIYIKITDEAGNIGYLNSDLLYLDTSIIEEGE